ncbi:hypothetical protein C8Q78DRAFT_680093 [Trametes maxima]|nr:hypothetical protein C8Q78DRAFT_680093 [Trametes maxima]
MFPCFARVPDAPPNDNYLGAAHPLRPSSSEESEFNMLQLRQGMATESTRQLQNSGMYTHNPNHCPRWYVSTTNPPRVADAYPSSSTPSLPHRAHSDPDFEDSPQKRPARPCLNSEATYPRRPWQLSRAAGAPRPIQQAQASRAPPALRLPLPPQRLLGLPLVLLLRPDGRGSPAPAPTRARGGGASPPLPQPTSSRSTLRFQSTANPAARTGVGVSRLISFCFAFGGRSVDIAHASPRGPSVDAWRWLHPRRRACPPSLWCVHARTTEDPRATRFLHFRLHMRELSLLFPQKKCTDWPPHNTAVSCSASARTRPNIPRRPPSHRSSRSANARLNAGASR